MDKKLEFYQMICPQCGGIAETDFVDIGVGMQQSGPFCCPECHWIEESVDEKLYGEVSDGYTAP